MCNTQTANKTLLKSITELVKINNLTAHSFSDGSKAQELLCDIQDQFEADGGVAGTIINTNWITKWNEVDLKERAKMLLSYVIEEMNGSVFGDLDI